MAKMIMQEERTLSLRQNAYQRRMRGEYLKHFEKDVLTEEDYKKYQLVPEKPTFSSDTIFGQFMNTMNSLIIFDNDPTRPEPKSQTTESTTFDSFLTNLELFILGLVIGSSG